MNYMQQQQKYNEINNEAKLSGVHSIGEIL